MNTLLPFEALVGGLRTSRWRHPSAATGLVQCLTPQQIGVLVGGLREAFASPAALDRLLRVHLDTPGADPDTEPDIPASLRDQFVAGGPEALRLTDLVDVLVTPTWALHLVEQLPTPHPRWLRGSGQRPAAAARGAVHGERPSPSPLCGEGAETTGTFAQDTVGAVGLAETVGPGASPPGRGEEKRYPDFPLPVAVTRLIDAGSFADLPALAAELTPVIDTVWPREVVGADHYRWVWEVAARYSAAIDPHIGADLLRHSPAAGAAGERVWAEGRA